MTEEEFKMRMVELAKDDPPISMTQLDYLIEFHLSWERNQIALHLHAAHERPRHFLKWSTIQKTMFVGNAPYVEGEYRQLKLGTKWRNYFIVKDPMFGRPVMSDLDLDTSGNFIHQAYALLEFERKSDIPVEQFDSIFEFGGGYGALCYIIHKLGFMGEYQLYDLPEMQLIQEYYLSNTIGGGVNISYENTVPLWQEIDLFIANTSISEVDIELRDKVFAVIDAKHYYIVYQRRFDGVENKDYFDRHREKTQDVIEWQSWTHSYKPILTFLYGRKRD